MLKLKKLIFISLAQLMFSFHGQGQVKADSVQIYWENGSLKYQSICCFTNPVMQEGDTVLISTRILEIWDKDSKEFLSGTEDFINKYGDIVELEKSPFKGKDEKEYRTIISKADSCFNKIDGSIESKNVAIRWYVFARNMIPEASYPKMKLAEIDRLSKVE